MAAYLDSIVIEYYTGSAWSDISAYVVGEMNGRNGLGGSDPDDRVAALGTLTLTLNNKDKKFSPMGGDSVRGLSTLTGFNKGAKLRVRGTLSGYSWTIWTGRIDSIDSDDLNWGTERVTVRAVDWMDVASRFPMKGTAIALSQTIDGAMTSLLAALSIQPEATDIDDGTETFPAVFDNVKSKTVAAGELQKLASSELGYIYLKGDGTLEVENFKRRYGTRPLTQADQHPSDYSHLTTEDGNILTTEAGDHLLVEQGITVGLATAAERYGIQLGSNSILNSASIKVYPVITDTSLKVLYSLGTPMRVQAKSTITFSAHYVDPNGLSQVSGTNMQTPVATTDYTANTLSNGSGTDKTSDLQVTATYYGDTVEYSIYNNSDVLVYITKLQARGYGIYYGAAIEFRAEDVGSIDDYGNSPFQFDQRYQRNVELASFYANSVINENRLPKSRLSGLTFLANLNTTHLMTFLSVDVGSLIAVTEDRSNISNHYYITNRQFSIKQGGIISVSYGLKQNDTYLSGGLSPLSVTFGHRSRLGGQRIDYGYLPWCGGLVKRTVSAWFYVKDNTAGYILANITDASNEGFTLALGGTQQLEWYQKQANGTLGVWLTPENSILVNTLYHVVIVHDRSDPDADPLIYLNGVQQVLTEDSTPIGSSVSTDDGLTYYIALREGYVRDVRMYDRCLSGAEVTTLYNSGTPSESLVTDGVIFQAPAVYTDKGDATSLSGYYLDLVHDRFTENGFRACGIPSGDITIGALTTAAMDWTEHNLAASTAMNAYDVCWAEALGLYILVGELSTDTANIQTSPDGVTWTKRTSASSGNLQGVAWSPELGLAVAVGQNKLYTSPDGINWTSRTAISSTTIWDKLAWSPELGLFVAIAINNATTGILAYSSDGINWTLVDIGLTSSGYDVAWSPKLGLFAACFNNTTSGIYTSPDGINWTARTTTNRVWRSIDWSPELGRFVCVSWDDHCMYSSDGINWTEADMGTGGTGQWTGLAWSSDLKMFWAIGDNGGDDVAFSYDGIHWGVHTPPVNDWVAVCAGQDMFCAVGFGTSHTVMTYS